MAPPRILDPRALPVAGVDSHLPAIDAGRLNAQALRERFAAVVDWETEFAGDGRTGSERVPAHAAVLIPLIETASGLDVLLTMRTAHLREHASQISFPGGRAEPEDDGPAETALREAEEEVGLSRNRVEVIGQMPTYTTVTQFIVTPVIGLIRPPFELGSLKLHQGEVAEAFQVPMAFLMNPANHRRHVFSFDGHERQFLSMQWQGTAPDGGPREYFIWGATAAMLRNLYRALAAAGLPLSLT